MDGCGASQPLEEHSLPPLLTYVPPPFKPMINIRNFYLPHLMQHPSDIPVVFTNWANDIDKRHINSKAHIAIADMTIAYLREQLCLVQRQAHAELEPQSDIWPKNDIAESLPRVGLVSAAYFDYMTLSVLMHSFRSCVFPSARHVVALG